MIINTRVDPQPGQRFTPGCFDENVGRIIDFLIPGDDHVGQGKVISAEVAEDGSHAWLTCDVPGLASDSPDIGAVLLGADDGGTYTGHAEEGI